MIGNHTIANSGSRLGSTPNANSLVELDPPPVGAPVPPSSSGKEALLSEERIGDEIRASESRCVPGGTVTRCLCVKRSNQVNQSQRFENAKCQDSRVIAAVHIINKSFQHSRSSTVLQPIAKRDDVNSDVVLLELLRQLDHRLLVLVLALARGRADEHDNALAEVLVFSVLQGELGDGKRGGDVDLAAGFVAGGEHAAQNGAVISRMCHQHLWTVDGIKRTNKKDVRIVLRAILQKAKMMMKLALSPPSS